MPLQFTSCSRFGSILAPLWSCSACFLIIPIPPAREDERIASVYGIRKEMTSSGTRYLVDYHDSAGRRTKRRFAKARDAEEFEKRVEASTYTGLPIPRPVTITFAAWAAEWLAQKAALSKAGKKPHPSTLHSWQSDLKSLLAYFGDHKLHTITTEAIVRYVEYMHSHSAPF